MKDIVLGRNGPQKHVKSITIKFLTHTHTGDCWVSFQHLLYGIVHVTVDGRRTVQDDGRGRCVSTYICVYVCVILQICPFNISHVNDAK